MLLTRRQSLALGASAFLNEILFANSRAIAAGKDTLTIAFNVNVPSFDPTSGLPSIRPSRRFTVRFSTSISARSRTWFSNPVF
jgi:hypothetical protein